MQNLLDEELPAEDVNEVVFLLLDNYLKEEDDEDLNAPERSDELLAVLNKVLDYEEEIEGKRIIPVVKNPGCLPGDGALLDKIKELLPDPVENEDAHNSGWDTVREIHGEAAVRYSNIEGRAEWNVVCLVARLITYFNFLTGDGLVSKKDSC